MKVAENQLLLVKSWTNGSAECPEVFASIRMREWKSSAWGAKGQTDFRRPKKAKFIRKKEVIAFAHSLLTMNVRKNLKIFIKELFSTFGTSVR